MKNSINWENACIFDFRGGFSGEVEIIKEIESKQVQGKAFYNAGKNKEKFSTKINKTYFKIKVEL